MDTWTSDEVVEWLHSTIRISEEKAEIFRDEEVDGRALLSFTEDRLKNDPFFLKTGPRIRIMEVINQFKNAPGKDLLLSFFHSLCYSICSSPARQRVSRAGIASLGPPSNFVSAFFFQMRTIILVQCINLAYTDS
jgi:hypothetical protein